MSVSHEWVSSQERGLGLALGGKSKPSSPRAWLERLRMPKRAGTVLAGRPGRELRLLGSELAQKEAALTLKQVPLGSEPLSPGVYVLGSRVDTHYTNALPPRGGTPQPHPASHSLPLFLCCSNGCTHILVWGQMKVCLIHIQPKSGSSWFSAPNGLRP